MTRWGLVLLWALATSATTAIAFWAVSAADSEVSQRPLTAVVASPPPTSASTSRSTPSSSTLSTTPVLPSSTTTFETPVGAPEWTRTTLNSEGGSIIVSYRPTEVRLESVAPLAGFSFEIDDQGPERVRVEFHGDNVTHTLRAEWTDEGFETDVDSSGEGGDD
jgi:hypothetical protein